MTDTPQPDKQRNRADLSNSEEAQALSNQVDTSVEARNCAFQFAIIRGEIRVSGFYVSGTPDIIEDTDLISLEEAKELWNKHLPAFKEAMEKNEPAEMCIWTGMKDNTDYHTALHALDTRDDIKLENGEIVKINKETLGEL